MQAGRDAVLIETLWNVKKVGALIIFRNGSRINRNIVECKEITIHLHSEHGLRINRNIVECKDVLDILCTASVDDINRNIVECKVGIALTCLECSG